MRSSTVAPRPAPDGTPSVPTGRPRQVAVGAVLLVLVVAGGAFRLWRVDDRTFTPDESYTAFAVDRPMADIPGFIADTDPHPPLFYLVVAPLQRVTDHEWAARVPSALCAVGALAAFALWQRSRGWEGVVATAVFAFASFQLVFAAQARMYGLLILAGVIAAWASERWLTIPSRRGPAIAAAAALVAAFSQASGLLLAGGLLLVPGLRRDRDAWQWRAWAVGVIGVFGCVWGATALGASGGSLYEPPGVDELAVTFNELLAPVPDHRWLVLLLVIGGVVALFQKWPSTARVWVALVAAPTLAAFVISFETPIFIPKTLAVVSWGMPVALAAAAGAAWRLRPVAGVAVGGVLLLLVVPFVGSSMSGSEHTEGVVRATQRAVHPGDAVAAHPPRTLIPWYLDQRESRPLSTPWPDTDAWIPGDAPFTGRVWVVDTLYAAPALELREPACGPDEVIDHVYRLRCVVVSEAAEGSP